MSRTKFSQRENNSPKHLGRLPRISQSPGTARGSGQTAQHFAKLELRLELAWSCHPITQRKGDRYALPLLSKPANKCKQDSLSPQQDLPLPSLPVLQGPIPHGGEGYPMARCRSEVAGYNPEPKRMGQQTSAGPSWKLRSGVLWSGLQTSRNEAPCRPYRTSKAHTAIEGRESGPPRESPVYLRDLPRIQASS